MARQFSSVARARVTERGGTHAKGLVEDVLLKFYGKFERPTPDEAARYDRYVGAP